MANRASSSTQADDGETDIICRGYGLGFLEVFSLFDDAVFELLLFLIAAVNCLFQGILLGH